MNTYYKLAEYIKAEADGKDIVYIPNFGNMGDAYIKTGTLEFFKAYDIEVHILSIRADGNNKDRIELIMKASKKPVLFLYGGGGAWNDRFNVYDWLLENLVEHGSIIVLPSSYETTQHANLRRTTFWTRDEPDDEHFCHDLAFCNKRYIIPMSVNEPACFFRRDKEGRPGPLPWEHLDPSAMGDHLSPIEDWLWLVHKYKTVHTDRLHIAIAREKALHLRTILYPGVSDKNLKVYETSKEFMPNTTFVNTHRYNWRKVHDQLALP